jgi:tripartite-type tricarboxylate transporter receptor subunit TctC
MKWNPLFAASLFTALALGTVPSQAQAQAFPSRPVTVIVPFPAGGGTDALMRSLAPAWSSALGQPVVIENRAGAGGTIGALAVANASPDGYLLGMATTSTHAIAAALYRSIKYDPIKSFTPIGLIGESPYVLAARPTLPAATLPDLIRLAKAQPGKLSYASVGAGTMSHLIAERFKAAAKIDLLHVPYKGAAPAQTDLLGGQVDLLFDNPATLAQQVRAGKMKAIAQTRRNALLPEVPLFADSGLAGFDDQLWYGVVAPAGTPAAARERLSAALREALGTRTMQASLLAQGVTPADPAPATFAATLARDVPSWARAVRQAGVQLD